MAQFKYPTTRQNRLYGMMQALMAVAAERTQPAPAGSRGVVTQQDALTAVLGLAAEIDRTAQAGALPKSRAEYMAELLMIIRDFIQPLPEGTAAEGGPDLVTPDLQAAVDEIRTASQNTGFRG